MSSTFSQGHALLVGVGGNLPTTVQDAIGLANILKDPGRCAYPPAQVHPLTEANATRDTVLKALDDLAGSSTADSTVIVYFSGHGKRVTTTIGSAYFLLTHGYDPKHLSDTAISGTELTAKLKKIPAKKLVLLLDCCYAGGHELPKAADTDIVTAALPSEALTLLGQGSGRVLIASSQDGELSFAGEPHSAFTLALIEALAGRGVAKKDGYVRIADLALYAAKRVADRTMNQQHPVLNFEKADNFRLAYYAGGDAEPKGLPFTDEPEIESVPGATNQRLIVQHIQQNNQSGWVVHGSVNQPAGNMTIINNGDAQRHTTRDGD